MIASKGYAVALAVAMLAAGWQAYLHLDEERDHAQTKAQYENQIAVLEAAARMAEEQYRAEEQRRRAALEGVVNDLEERLVESSNAAAAAVGDSRRLRNRVAQLAATCGQASGDTGTPGQGQATRSSGDLLADVFERGDEALREIAQYADRARIAGLACQESYDALKD